ncbi:hypothetical protein I3760_10G035500 [Carya illinoinensis]|nr:hypothetical protein I3760_10G035500 [Carya illinoinensis]
MQHSSIKKLSFSFLKSAPHFLLVTFSRILTRAFGVYDSQSVSILFKIGDSVSVGDSISVGGRASLPCEGVHLGGQKGILELAYHMAATISQLSCFSAVNRSLKLQRLSYLSPSPKFTVLMSLEGRRTYASSSEIKTSVSYTAGASNSQGEGIANSYPDFQDVSVKSGTGEPVQENGVIEQQRAAKIHDFCFGIPFGGLVLSGGLLGFVFSRNLATLSTGVLFGGALLALSTFSLKIWRQGKSCTPFILGQAALSIVLLWKNYQTYSLTKKIFPPGFYVAISAAMLCFYSYVLISGGNPPPKKLKSSSGVAS